VFAKPLFFALFFLFWSYLSDFRAGWVILGIFYCIILLVEGYYYALQGIYFYKKQQ